MMKNMSCDSLSPIFQTNKNKIQYFYTNKIKKLKTRKLYNEYVHSKQCRLCIVI